MTNNFIKQKQVIYFLASASKSKLIYTDIFFIVLALFLGFISWKNIINYIPIHLGLEYDYSIPNIYNFLKWMAVSYAFFALWTHSLQIIHAVLSVIFISIFFDDSFEIHEKINATLSQLSGVPAHYAGAFLLMALAFTAGLLTWFAVKKSSNESRAQAKIITILLGCLVIVGGGLDAFQSEIRDIFPRKYSWHLAYAVGVLEDGLELIIASLILLASRTFLKEYIKKNSHSIHNDPRCTTTIARFARDAEPRAGHRSEDG